MGNLKLDPSDPRYYGYVNSSGHFERLGRFPSQDECNNREPPERPKSRRVHFSSDRQRVQYEHITGDYSTATHYNARCSVNPQTDPEFNYKAGYKQKGVFLFELIKGKLIMPGGADFPDEAYDGYMWSWPESKESDGMKDCLKRYRKGKKAGYDYDLEQEIARAMKAAAEAVQRKIERDLFGGV